MGERGRERSLESKTGINQPMAAVAPAALARCGSVRRSRVLSRVRCALVRASVYLINGSAESYNAKAVSEAGLPSANLEC